MVKYTLTIRWLLPTNCLSVFDHCVGWVNVLQKINMPVDALNRYSKKYCDSVYK